MDIIEDKEERKDIEQNEEESDDSLESYEKENLHKKSISTYDTLPSPIESESESNEGIKDHEKDNKTTVSNKKVDDVSHVPTTEYSTQCQAVDHLSLDDVESLERGYIARRKMCILNKVYSEQNESNDTVSSKSNI